MLAMSVPDLIAAHRATEECHRCIENKGGKDNERDPQIKDTLSGSEHGKAAGQETGRNASDITHEDLRRREIVHQKSHAGGGLYNCEIEEHRIMADPEQIGQRAETKHGHSTGESVHAIHEVIQIRHPDKKHQCDRYSQPTQFDLTPSRQVYDRQADTSAEHDSGSGKHMACESQRYWNSPTIIHE